MKYSILLFSLTLSIFSGLVSAQQDVGIIRKLLSVKKKRLQTSNDLDCKCRGTGSKCHAGKYRKTSCAFDGSECCSCDTGRYQDVNKHRRKSCKICGSGKYNDQVGRTAESSCKTCPSGTYSTAGAASCPYSTTTCPAGTYVSGTTACKSCVSGTATVCHSCASGTYSTAGAASCPYSTTTCPAGTYAIGGTTACDSCASGKYSTVGASSCRYSTTTCPAGTYATNGIAALSACESCPSGDFSDVGAFCSHEYNYTFWGDEADKKSWVDSETFCNSLGPTCHLASIHTLAENTLIENKISSNAWIGSNRETTVSYFVNIDGTSTDYTNWNDYEPNNSGGQEECTVMYEKDGKWNDASCGGKNNFICKCITVPSTCCQYTNTTCPAGTHASGTASCETCPTGQYNDQNGQSSCETCPTGQYNDQNGQSSCKECATGQYNEQTSQSSCKECAIGQYNEQTSQSSCKKCATGKYTGNLIGLVDQSSCQTCANGKFSYAGASRCCQAKYFEKNGVCTKCPWMGQCYHFFHEYPTSRLAVVGDGRTAYSGKRYTLDNWIQGNAQTNVGLYDAPVAQIDFGQDCNCTTGDVFVQTESQCRDVAWFKAGVTTVTVTQDSSKRVGCYSTTVNEFSFNTFANQTSGLKVGTAEWCRKLE